MNQKLGSGTSVTLSYGLIPISCQLLRSSMKKSSLPHFRHTRRSPISRSHASPQYSTAHAIASAGPSLSILIASPVAPLRTIRRIGMEMVTVPTPSRNWASRTAYGSFPRPGNRLLSSVRSRLPASATARRPALPRYLRFRSL